MMALDVVQESLGILLYLNAAEQGLISEIKSQIYKCIWVAVTNINDTFLRE